MLDIRKSKFILVGFLLTLLIAFTLLSTGCPTRPTQPDETRTDKEEPKPVEAQKVGYVGSEKCGTCHSDLYEGWDNTLHRRMVQDGKKQGVVIGDFTKSGNPFEVTKDMTQDDIVYTIGSKWKQRYVIKQDDNYHILPAQWVVKTQSWSPYHADDWNERVWQDLCITCHTTGYSTDAREINEAGIGCEACHGPGNKHVESRKAEDIVNPAKLEKDKSTALCAQCHVRGKNKDGKREDALGFKPGENLLEEVFNPLKPDPEKDKDNPKAAFHPDGASKKHHQQYNDFVQSEHYKSGKVSCADCHESHMAATPDGDIPLKEGSLDALCTKCHKENGTAHPLQTPINIDKYMPKRAKSATDNDIRSHTFHPDQPNTAAKDVPYTE